LSVLFGEVKIPVVGRAAVLASHQQWRAVGVAPVAHEVHEHGVVSEVGLEAVAILEEDSQLAHAIGNPADRQHFDEGRVSSANVGTDAAQIAGSTDWIAVRVADNVQVQGSFLSESGVDATRMIQRGTQRSHREGRMSGQ
jgi:hypothetical protein